MKYNLKTGVLSVETYQTNFEFSEITGVGSRNNIKRGFVFVSKILGKHYPVKPNVISKYNDLLSEKLFGLIGDNNKNIFIGFAETATLISEDVFQKFSKLDKENDFNIFQSSTRFLTSNEKSFNFFEEHCHAPSHIFYKMKDSDLEKKSIESENIVLIDDEVSTGKTSLNMIKELLKKYKNIKKVYITSILNWMSKENIEIINKYLKDRGIEVEFVYLLKGDFEFDFDKDFKDNFVSSKSVCDFDEIVQKDYLDRELIIYQNDGRFGTKPYSFNDFEFDFNKRKNKKVLVLGTAEFMYKPYLFATELEKNCVETYFQATTRSPLNIDSEIKSKISFIDNYGEEIDNFLYNVIDKVYDEIIICYEVKNINETHKLEEILNDYGFVVTKIILKDI